MRAIVTFAWSPQRRRAAASAASATSTASSVSQRSARRRVSTPIEQPISNADPHRAGSAASVTSYFSRSYALVVNCQGSGLAA